MLLTVGHFWSNFRLENQLIWHGTQLHMWFWQYYTSTGDLFTYLEAANPPSPARPLLQYDIYLNLLIFGTFIVRSNFLMLYEPRS